ncbi:hypothetical protein EYR40_009724 [Pleurotus pulmonarius]|nr:hypothetical protein EYR38_002765 [Pleurotus pulmonarius]KAF4591124.1 hypothetical protein EYR40_009724 [Pleurotus pulmonarius]
MSLLPVLRLEELALIGWHVDENGSDILPFLSASSNSLNELVIVITHAFGQETESTAPATIRLGALRELAVIGKGDRFPRINAIECPNLRSLTIEHLGDGPWGVPPGISGELADLTVTGISSTPPRLTYRRLTFLSASCSSLIPELGHSMRPSDLKLDMQRESHESYHNVMVWVRDCIACLPFPYVVHELVIEITNEESTDLDALEYPSLYDYEELYCAVRSLPQHGALRKMVVALKTFITSGKIYEDNYEREDAKLKEAFGPLLRTGKMAVSLTLDQVQD